MRWVLLLLLRWGVVVVVVVVVVVLLLLRWGVLQSWLRKGGIPSLSYAGAERDL